MAEASLHEYPFKWLALFPLMAAKLSEQKFPEALVCAQSLLAPEQQALPTPLSKVLEAAVSTGGGGNLEALNVHLGKALKLAEIISYSGRHDERKGYLSKAQSNRKTLKAG